MPHSPPALQALLVHIPYRAVPCPGVLTAVAAVMVNYGVENISGLKFWATLQLLSRGHVLGSFAGYAAMNAALVAASAAITLWVGPAAAGSGIAEVKVRGRAGRRRINVLVSWCNLPQQQGMHGRQGRHSNMRGSRGTYHGARDQRLWLLGGPRHQSVLPGTCECGPCEYDRRT